MIAKTTGEGIKLAIQGKERIFSPLSMGDFAALEQHLLKLRISAYMSVCLDPPQLRTSTIIELTKMGVTSKEVDDFMQTIGGQIFMIYRSLLHKDSYITLDDVENLIDTSNVGDFVAVVQALSLPNDADNINKKKLIQVDSLENQQNQASPTEVAEEMIKQEIKEQTVFMSENSKKQSSEKLQQPLHIFSK